MKQGSLYSAESQVIRSCILEYWPIHSILLVLFTRMHSLFTAVLMCVTDKDHMVLLYDLVFLVILRTVWDGWATESILKRQCRAVV